MQASCQGKRKLNKDFFLGKYRNVIKFHSFLHIREIYRKHLEISMSNKQYLLRLNTSLMRLGVVKFIFWSCLISHNNTYKPSDKSDNYNEFSFNYV